jgi:two-component system chemotaxis sensor kinase CheA
MDDLLSDFLTESSENLMLLDQEIVELERTPDDPQLLQSVFRTIHTIKGTGGFLDLGRLEAVAHAAENVLGLMRDGTLAVTTAAISDVLAAVDAIKLILEGLAENGTEPAGGDAALIARLAAWTAGHEQDEVAPDEIVFPVPVAAPAPPAAGEVAAETVVSATSDATPSPAPVADTTLRVNVSLLDRLMNLAGELVLTRNQLSQLASAGDDTAFRLPLQHLNRVTTELQDAVMRTRMQPIGNAWGRLPRLVRDLAQSSGKAIELEMAGADTELDRQILQAIGDPLTHMVRNSADHGVESVEARRAAGKQAHGTIRLNAYHEGGHIVIEVGDDGRGLDAEALRHKAVERGLATAEAVAALSDAQVFRFIFAPGFSTAARVTNVSGRGVGMDVVRSNIEAIGGTIDLASTLGEGTTVRIKIPLTLAILSALIVGAAGQSFAIPQIAVVEIVRIGEAGRARVQRIHGAYFFRLRETLLPLLRLGEVLGLEPAAGVDDAARSIVVCQVGAYRFGLVVDDVFDTQEIVVKPLGRMVQPLSVYSGTTILGDGRVIMILDAAHVATRVHNGAAGTAEAADSATDAEDEREASGREALVVFRAGTAAPRAVPLALVSRLETVSVDEIEHADGRWLVQYRGGLLPLVPAAPQLEMHAGEERPVIVFSDGDRSVGLAVDAIHDIVEDRLDVQLASTTPGVLGTATIAGRATEVLDVDHFMRAADPEWFGAGALRQVHV